MALHLIPSPHLGKNFPKFFISAGLDFYQKFVGEKSKTRTFDPESANPDPGTQKMRIRIPTLLLSLSTVCCQKSFALSIN